MDTSRYVYNRALEGIKVFKDNINFKTLRNRFVTSKNNPNVKKWELKTPKDIRSSVIKELETAYKNGFQALNTGQITHFSLQYRSKKCYYPISIPHTAIKIINNKIIVYSSYGLGPIKVSKDKLPKSIKHGVKIFTQGNNRWFLSVPITIKSDNRRRINNICALDPGVISFQTVYSENEIVKFNGNEKIKEEYTKMDKTQSLISKNTGRKRTHLKRKLKKIYDKYHNLINDLHYKVINYLTKRYKIILLPHFESQDMIGKNRKSNRWLLGLKHYQFKERLIQKCSLIKNCSVMLVNEAYTSKTCGMCGTLNEVGNKRMFKCKKCHVSIDRDVNGARNIFLKYLK